MRKQILSIRLLALLIATTPTMAADLSTGDSSEKTNSLVKNNISILDQILVDGRGGLDQTNKTATKMDISIRDTGRSISVLDERALREMNATDIEQVLDYMPGFSMENTTSGSLTVRGMTTDYSNILIDGLRTLQGTNDGDGGRTGSLLPSTYNLESAAFMRGQDGILYGSGIGGGMINLTTKKPSSEAMTAIGMQGNSYVSGDTGYFKRNRLSLNVDSTGPISDKILYRVIAQHTPSGQYFQKGLDVDETMLDLSMTFLPWRGTKITPRFEYVERKFSGVSNILPVFDQSYFSPGKKYGTPSQRKYQYGSDQDYNHNKTMNADLTLEHEFNDNWKLASRLRYSRTNAEQLSLELSGGKTAGALWEGRTWRAYKNDDKYKLLDIGVQGKFNTGTLKHHLLFGGSYRDFNTDYGGAYQSSKDSANNQISAANPANQTVGAIPANVQNFQITPKGVEDINIYLKDRIQIGKWTISPGLSYVAQEQTRSRSSRLTYTQVYQDSYKKLLWDLGAMYAVNNNFNIFATYSRAYDPVNVRYIGQYGYKFNGLGEDDYAAVEGNNYEIGFKGNLFDGLMTASVTAFKLDRENKTEFDCSYKISQNCILMQIKGPNFTSKGVEIDLSYKPTNQWSGSLNYAFTRSTFTKGAKAGLQSDNSPKHSIAIWNRYRLSGNLNNFKLGLGIRYESKKRFSDNIVPAYVEADAGIYYDDEKWEASLLLKNAFDKNRARNGSSNFLVTPNEPRALTFNIKRYF